MRVVETETYREPRDAISHDFVHWLCEMGHTPVLIPNGLRAPGAYSRDFGIEALLLTSGNDVKPRPGVRDETSSERDRTEHALLDFAVDSRTPVLGVCRGMHLINLHFGGAVLSDIRKQRPDSAMHVAVDHCVRLEGEFQAVAGSACIITNSFHNQAVAPEGVGGRLVPFARCEADGLIEGLHHADLPIVGIQWHPERPNPAKLFDRAIAQNIFRNGRTTT